MFLRGKIRQPRRSAVYVAKWELLARMTRCFAVVTVNNGYVVTVLVVALSVSGYQRKGCPISMQWRQGPTRNSNTQELLKLEIHKHSQRLSFCSAFEESSSGEPAPGYSYAAAASKGESSSVYYLSKHRRKAGLQWHTYIHSLLIKTTKMISAIMSASSPSNRIPPTMATSMIQGRLLVDEPRQSKWRKVVWLHVYNIIHAETYPWRDVV